MKNKLSALLLSTSLLACSGMVFAASNDPYSTQIIAKDTLITLKNNTNDEFSVSTNTDSKDLSYVMSIDGQPISYGGYPSYYLRPHSTQKITIGGLTHSQLLYSGNFLVDIATKDDPIRISFPIGITGPKAFLERDPAIVSPSRYAVSAIESTPTTSTIEINAV